MGLFDSEYEYHAFSSMQELIADEDKHDTLNSFVYSATRDPNLSVGEAVVAATQAGLPGLCRNYYRYGKKKYYFGLPETTFTSATLDVAKIREVLGPDKNIHKFHVPVSAEFITAVEYLRAQAWWDISLDRPTLPLNPYEGYPFKMSSPTDFKVEVEEYNLWIVIPLDWSDYGAEPPVGAPTEWRYFVNRDSLEDRLGMWLIYYTGLEADIPGNLEEATYYYPSDAFPEPPVVEDTEGFLPVASFVQDNIDYRSNEEWDKTLKGLLYKLNMRHDEIYDEFQKALEESNADNLELLDFFIGFFVPLKDAAYGGLVEPNERVEVYAFKVAQQLYLQNIYTREDYNTYVDAQIAEQDPDAPPFSFDPFDLGMPPTQYIYVTEGGGSTFLYNMRWSFVEKYTSDISIEDAIKDFEEVVTAPVPPGTFFNQETQEGLFFVGTEIDEFTEERVYVAYYIFNLAASFGMNTPDGVKGVKSPELFMPVNYELLQDMPFREQEQVLQDSLRSVVFTVIEEEIKWYSKAFWGGIFAIITIAVVAFTLYIGGLTSLTTVLAGGAAAGIGFTLAAFALKIAVGFLISFTTNILFQNSIIAQLVSTIVMIAIGTPGGMKGFFESRLSNFGKTYFGDVRSILKTTYSLTNTGYKIKNYMDMQELQDDLAKSEQQQAEDDDNAYYGTSDGGVNGLLAIGRELHIGPMESQSEFYDRKTRTNSSQLSLEYVSKFVENALTLPNTIRPVDMTGNAQGN